MSATETAEKASPIRDLLLPPILALLIFQVLSGVLVSPLFGLFPIYVEKVLRQRPEVAGDIRILFVVCGGVIAVIGGALCDRFGRKPIYLLAMTGVTAGGFLFLVPHVSWMFPLAIYGGVMFGMGSVAGQSYLLDLVPTRSLALATACYFLTGTVGNMVGGMGSAVIAANVEGGYRLLGWGMVIGHTLLLIAAMALMPAAGAPRKKEAGAEKQIGLVELLGRPAILALLTLRFLPTVYWGAVTFLMPLLLFRLTRSEIPAGHYLAASGALSAVCQLGAGRLVDRIGPRVPVLVSITLVTLASLGQGLGAHHVPTLVGFALLGAGAAWSLSISMTTLIQRLSSPETKGRLLGLTHAAWSAGFLSGTKMGSVMAGWGSAAGNAFLICAGGGAIAIASALIVVRALPSEPRKP